MLSLRLLHEAGLAVERALEQSLIQGRTQTARICSRDTRSLDATAPRETAVESLSKNFTDPVLAPLFWLNMASLPSAAVKRYFVESRERHAIVSDAATQLTHRR